MTAIGIGRNDISEIVVNADAIVQESVIARAVLKAFDDVFRAGVGVIFLKIADAAGMDASLRSLFLGAPRPFNKMLHLNRKIY